MFLSDFLSVVVGGGVYFSAVAQTEGGGRVLDIDIFWRGDICNMSYLVTN